MAHFFRMALEIPDGPGALWGCREIWPRLARSAVLRVGVSSEGTEGGPRVWRFGRDGVGWVQAARGGASGQVVHS